MIVKMNKVTLLVSARDRQTALEKLRELGILHVQVLPQTTSESSQKLETELARIDEAAQVLAAATPNGQKSTVDAPALVEQTLAARREIIRLEGRLQEFRNQYRWYEDWGHISKESLETLKNNGVYVRFYRAIKEALAHLPEDKTIHIVQQDKQTVQLALFGASPEERLDLAEVFPPEMDVNTLETEIAAMEQALSEQQNTLQQLAGSEKILQDHRREVEKRLEFERVKDSLGSAEAIEYLQGFCPVNTTADLQQAAADAGWAYLLEKPSEEDDVPTLIKIPKWLRIVNPVFDFMGTVPGYREHDVSFWFLLFFSIFFAMLVGDAGYGLIFLAGTLLLRRKMKQAPKEPFILMIVLSCTTIAWGTITGTWFGYEAIARLPFFNSLIISQVDSFVAENQAFMMYLSFIIGVIHLTIAHLVVAVSQINSLKALAQIGWIGVLWALFFLAGNLVLKNALPDFMFILLGAGAGLVLLFSNFQKNIFKGILHTLTNLPLDIISAFSDVVSYIRLFAVGLATVIVAQSFNDMAIAIGAGSFISGLMAALVLFVGHALNIILALMAVVVHGIRLNMLEFSGHLSMQWSGKPYRPFKS